jgi:hypothetical protein
MQEVFAKDQSDKPIATNPLILTNRKYVEKAIQGDLPCIFIIAGQSCSGKSTVVHNLEQSGIAPTVRLLPRQRRSDDVKGDLAWNNSISKNYEADIKRVVFSDHKYKGYYGFPINDLVTELKNNKGVSFIIGRCIEIPALIEAISNTLPLMPIIPIRLEVPVQVLAERLMKRPEAYPGEFMERERMLNDMNLEDRTQIKALHAIYGLNSILNISQEERDSLGMNSKQVRHVDSSLINELSAEYQHEAQVKSKLLAKDLIKLRTLSHNNPNIPPALIDVLENKLVPEAKKMGLPLYLKGGLAVAIYLENSRQVSADIDFTVDYNKSCEQKIIDLLKSVTNKEHNISDAWNKKIYHVRGVSTATNSTKYDQLVELDAISLTRVQPNNHGFNLVLGFDALDRFYRRTVRLSTGDDIFLVPPEHIIIEKLLAGRGPEMDKFDLFDAAGLMASLPIDLVAIRRIIDSQVYDDIADVSAKEILKGREEISVSEVVKLFNIQSQELINNLTNVTDQFQLVRISRTPSSDRSFGIDELKRFVLIDKLMSSVNRIRKDLNNPLVPETHKVENAYDSSLVINATNKLENLFEYYIRYELGIRDIYIKRPNFSKISREEFFIDLEQQKIKLSKD